MVPDRIEREVVIDAPVERVFAMLTEAEHIQQWFAFDGATIDLRPGGALVLHWKEHGTYHARIERIEPERFISFRGARLPDEQPGAGNSTLVEFTVTPEGSGARLRVVESGFTALDLPEAEQAESVAGNIEGWNGAFATLREYAERQAA